VPPRIESKLGLEDVPWPAARAHMFGRLQVPFGDQPRRVPDDLIDASLRWLSGQIGGTRTSDLGCGLGSLTRRNSV
jgi:hypothetical protein